MLASFLQVLSLALALVVPLSESERTVIATARDDRSHEEEAFAVLLSHAAAWTGELGDQPIRLTPDFEAMIAAPDQYRGELCRIEGRLEQRTGLGGAFEGDEWFIRTADQTAVVVYLPMDERMKRIRDGQHVAIDARFYKRMRFEGRDDETHAYAAFVGARPWLLDAPNPWRHLWVIAVLVLILFVAFIVLFAIVRRGRATQSGSRRRGDDAYDATDAEADEGLPSDAVAALEELARRRGGQQG